MSDMLGELWLVEDYLGNAGLVLNALKASRSSSFGVNDERAPSGAIIHFMARRMAGPPHA